MRCVSTILIGLAAVLLVPALGAVVGFYGGFYLVGIPEGPHCGQAAIPAIVVGGLGASLGIVVGGICGMAVFGAICEQQCLIFGDDNPFFNGESDCGQPPDR
jgi:hypothetical protein